ncbi:MAG: oligosaccharide repeat unit polymerase [Bacteroidales bacterium]|nr:oligosaccharide repeat unit polymerase [Bacteroidales bacterium]
MNNIILEILYNFLFLIIGMFMLNIYIKNNKLNIINILGLSHLTIFALLSLISIINGRIVNPFTFWEITRYYLSILLTTIGIFSFNIFLPKKLRYSTEINKLLKKYLSIPVKKKFIFFTITYIISWNIKITFNLSAYGSGNIDRVLALPYYIVVSKQLIEIILNGIAYIEIALIVINKSYIKWIYHLPIIISMIILVATSRSWFLWLFVLSILIYFWLNQKVNIKMFLKYLPIIFFIYLFLFPLIIGYRNTQVELNNENENLAGIELYRETLIRLWKKDYSEFKMKNKENLESRANFMEKNNLIMDEASIDPMMGELFFSSILYLIPRFFLPDKFVYFGAHSNEVIIGNYYGIPLTDISDNIPLYGYVDFLLPGCLLAGLIVSLIIYICFKIIMLLSDKFTILATSIFAIILVTSFRVEANYILFFSLLRNILVIYILIMLYDILRKYLLTKL